MENNQLNKRKNEYGYPSGYQRRKQSIENMNQHMHFDTNMNLQRENNESTKDTSISSEPNSIDSSEDLFEQSQDYSQESTSDSQNDLFLLDTDDISNESSDGTSLGSDHYFQVDADFKEEFIEKLRNQNNWASNPSIPDSFKVPSYSGSKVSVFEHLMMLLEERIAGNTWVSIKREVQRLNLIANDVMLPSSIKKLKKMLGNVMLPCFKFVTCESGINDMYIFDFYLYKYSY